MSTDPVLIEDDDVDMEPVVILDEDDEKINNEENGAVSTVETIDLDDDAVIVTTNDNSVSDNVVPTDQTKIFLNKSELSFINNLKNNRLMDKIVTCCLNMPNALGMTRVINKTVIPLYRDANVHYKQSGKFRKLLKNTLRSLTKDPDHKFLHVKTLCEELKSGGLRRKVPFVTLATNLSNYEVHGNGREIESSSRGTPQTHQSFDSSNNRKQNTEKNNKFTKYISERKRKKRGAPVKKKAAISRKVKKVHSMETRKHSNMLKEKTDVINLDNSDNESVINLDNDDIRNDTTITEKNVIANRGDHSNKNNVREKTQVTDYFIEINVTENTQETGISNIGNVLDKAQEGIVDPNKSNVTETEDFNKENKKQTNENHSKSDESFDYDLLIPQNHVEVVMEETAAPSISKVDFIKVIEIERTMAAYQQVIAKMEEAEVTDENELSSPYVSCANLKKHVVKLYKQLCKINGYSEDIVKRREIRLHVVEGHPSGPAKRLEYFLNSTIDSTGTVAFPDFADVVKCVIEANIEDNLGWGTQKVFQEASALFHHCGQALRKRRQKREYRDLLSLVNNRELTDDPAERDPSLQAKLEENKRIAKVKEDQILERYVNMERGNVVNDVNKVNNIVQFETSQDSTDSETDSEPNVPIDNNKTTAINQQCVAGESSKTNVVDKDLDVRLSNNIINTTSVNNIATTSINNIVTTTINNGIGSSCEIGESSSTNIIDDSSNLIWKPVNSYVVIPPVVNHQNHLGESSQNNSDVSYFYVLSTNNTITNAQSNPEQILNNNIASNNNLYLTITPSSVANVQTTDNNEITSKNNVVIENPAPGVPSGPCISSAQNSVTCTSNDVKQDAGPSSIEPDCEVKLEVKKEPIDVQGMLDELGDNFVCTVFDVEDPFLVIEISSDGYSDDEK